MAPYFVDDNGYCACGGYMWRSYDEVLKYEQGWHFLIEFATEDKPRNLADVWSMIDLFALKEYPPGHEYYPVLVEHMKWLRNELGERMNACLVRMNRSPDKADLFYIDCASEADLNVRPTGTHFKNAVAFPFLQGEMVVAKYCIEYEIPEVQTWIQDSNLPWLWRLHPDTDKSGFQMPPDVPMSDFWAGIFDEEPAE